MATLEDPHKLLNHQKCDDPSQDCKADAYIMTMSCLPVTTVRVRVGMGVRVCMASSTACCLRHEGMRDEVQKCIPEQPAGSKRQQHLEVGLVLLAVGDWDDKQDQVWGDADAQGGHDGFKPHAGLLLLLGGFVFVSMGFVVWVCVDMGFVVVVVVGFVVVVVVVIVVMVMVVGLLFTTIHIPVLFIGLFTPFI